MVFRYQRKEESKGVVIGDKLLGFNLGAETPLLTKSGGQNSAVVGGQFSVVITKRVAELECGLSWSQIQRELDRLQVTEFFDLKNRVLMRNEISSETSNILKKLKIQTPKQILEVENPD